MAKEMMSARIDGDLRDALAVEAAAERRTVSNMLEWILRERYSQRRTVDLVDGAGRFVESVDVTPTRAVLEGRGSADGAQGDPATAFLRAHETESARSSSADRSGGLCEPAVSREVHDVEVVMVRPHMRKDRPAIECPERILSGECSVCGRVVT